MLQTLKEPIEVTY